MGGFFVDRPVFAIVISIIISILGGLAYFQLPVEQYLEIAPPQIVVRAQYPGADADTVATPLEQEINGVEGMIYMSSYSVSDGSVALTITFELGTDLDAAQVLAQNRVSIAEARLPEDVRALGVTTVKSSPDLMMVVHMLSPDDTFGQLYVSNYARARVRDVLVRLDGVGDLQIFGEREFAARIWLDPDRLASLGLTAGDVAAALREQNVQVSGGSLGAPPNEAGGAFQASLTTQGRLSDPDDFGRLIVRATEDGRIVRVRDVALAPLGALVELRETAGPALVQRYNMLASVPVQGAAAPGFSTGEALDAMERLVEAAAEPGMTFEWTERALQERQQGDLGVYVFGLSILFAFLVLAALYESCVLPLAIILIVPLAALSALLGVDWRGMDNNVLTQVGLIVLVGLAAKNAILIVEFARQAQAERGLSAAEAAVEARRLRLRPILMTAFAFIPGVAPLVVSTGPGAEMRQAIGTAVFSGMIGVTALGLFLTPVFFVVLRSVFGRRRNRSPERRRSSPQSAPRA